MSCSYACDCTAGLGRAGAAAAATDAEAPALHKIERTAIAASTHITYPPAELLTLIEDHLRASGLHASADALAAEAGLDRQWPDAELAGGIGPPLITAFSAEASPGDCLATPKLLKGETSLDSPELLTEQNASTLILRWVAERRGK